MYGLSWIALAAQMAFCTCAGASAGAAAVPSGISFASAPGTVRFTTGGGGGGYCAPPEALGAADCAMAAAGNSRKDIDVRVSANARRENKPYSSFVGLRG